MPIKSPKPGKKKITGTRRVRLTVNGRDIELEGGPGLGQIEAAQTLASTLRETLGLTGTKVSCDHGACGSCTVLINGEPRMSCVTLTVECDRQTITTIEGLEDPAGGELDPLQAYLRLHPDGTALIFSCLTEHGTGQKSNLMKMAAEVLQIPLKRAGGAIPLK